MVTRATHIRRPRRASGLTLVEVLVSLAVLGLMTGIGYPVIQNLMHRAKIDSSARETAGFMRLARLEAIRNSRPVMVVADADNREIVVFVDENFDVLYGPEDQMIGRKDLPAGVFYLEPGGATGVDSVDGFIIDGESRPGRLPRQRVGPGQRRPAIRRRARQLPRGSGRALHHRAGHHPQVERGRLARAGRGWHHVDLELRQISS